VIRAWPDAVGTSWVVAVRAGLRRGWGKDVLPVFLGHRNSSGPATRPPFRLIGCAVTGGWCEDDRMGDASGVISTTFLRDTQHGGGAGQLAEIAADLAAFILAARSSVDVAIYDLRLSDPVAANLIVAALANASDRGVTVRIAYDAGKPAAGSAADFAVLQADPAPAGTAEWVGDHFGGTAVLTKPIAAGGQLMHSKYVIRDVPVAGPGGPGPAGTGAVWTGSTNFTDDAWTRQENNVIAVTSDDLAVAFRTDFDQMWAAGAIAGTGKRSAGSATAGGGSLGWDFCPGDGSAVNTALAARVSAATSRLVVASMVLTSHEVLAALSAAIDRGVPLTGIYDGGQMDPIVAGWRSRPADAGVVADWEKVSARLAHKQSAPYSPTSVHDFMHLKVLISDDEVTTGSYNFSANAEHNAENQIHLTDAGTVAAYAGYIDTVISAYAGP
jgi:phosphatidylserine/phosphatidylglycerophosphate/cardiolipin synthase-like enzyme